MVRTGTEEVTYKGLPGVADCENHYKCIFRNSIFTGGFLPGLINGLPGVADCENEQQTNHNAGQSGQDIGRPPQVPGNVRLREKTTINVVFARENPRD